MLTCREIAELVTEYLDGRMSWTRRLQFQLHVGMCGSCRRYLRQMRTTMKTLGKLPDEPLPKQVETELLARFRTWKKPV
jgi:anti-sigma factor RsiW